MNKWVFNIILFAIVLSYSIFMIILLQHKERIEALWLNLDAHYSQRSNLVLELVDRIKINTKEDNSKLLNNVRGAHTRVNAIKIHPSDLDDVNLVDCFEYVQNALTTEVSLLLSAYEQHPVLKEDNTYQDCLLRLEIIEYRINAARLRYLSETKVFNAKISKASTFLPDRFLVYKKISHLSENNAILTFNRENHKNV